MLCQKNNAMVATDSCYLQLLLELGIHGGGSLVGDRREAARHQVRYGNANSKERFTWRLVSI